MDKSKSGSHEIKDRLAYNEKLLRTKNTAAKDGVKKFFHDDKSIKSAPMEFACECSDLACHERIELSINAYEKIHQQANHFVIKKGHDIPDIEKIISKKSTYDIIKKI